MDTRLGKIYSIILCISMCISMYVFSFFDSLPIVYLLYILFSFAFMIRCLKSNNIKVNITPIVLIIFLVLLSVINILFSSDISFSSNVIINSGKMLIWGLILTFSIPYIDKKKFYKFLYYLSLATTLYLFVQSVFFYGFSISLSNVFDIGFIKFKTLDMGTLTSIYRPSSFFAEPIDYSNFTIICIVLSLFDEDYKKIINKKVLIFYILSVLLCASTTGIFILLMVLAIYEFKESKKNFKILIVSLFFVLPVAIYIYFNYESILLSLGSVGKTLYNTINKLTYSSSSSRIGGSYDRLELLSPVRFIFGYGIGNEYVLTNNIPQYMNTITRSIYQFGLFGSIIVLFFFVKNFFKMKNNVSKILILITLIECFTSNILFSISNIFFFSIIFICNKKNEGD